MKMLLTVLTFLFVLALHSSIALMEIFAWSICLLTVCLKLGHPNFKKFSPSDFPLWIPLISLAIWAGFSLLVNPNLKPFMFQFGFFKWILLLWSFTWCLNSVWSENFETRLIKVWIILMIITSSYGFLQFLTGADLIGLHSKTGGSMGDGTWRPTGFFSMSLTYAYCIGASAFLCTFAAMGLKNKTWLYFSAIFGVLGVLVAASRGAWIGILLTLFLYFLFAQRRLIIPFFILSGISFGALVMKSSSAYRRISELLHGQLDESSQIRYHLWQAYTKMIAEHPFLGVGLFQTEQFLPEYYKKINIQESFVSHAHNIYLQWAAGAGLPALILFLFIAGHFLIKSFRLTKTSPWGWALFLAQVYLLIGGLTEANFIDAEVNHIWIFSWALTQFFSVTQPLAHAKSA